MLDKLNGLNGDDFRKEYFCDQVSAHKDAVSLFERYGKGGENPKLKDWASTTLPALQHHLGRGCPFECSFCDTCALATQDNGFVN